MYRIQKWIALSWLRVVRSGTQARIDAGDLDFDNIVYRSRDAAATLIEIWGRPDERCTDA